MAETDNINTQGDAEFNREIRSWVKKVKNELIISAASKTRKGKKFERIAKDEYGSSYSIRETILHKDIRGNVKIAYGQIEKVSFSFPRHGIYWQKGVSRGHDKDNKRNEVDWFTSIIENNVPQLEEIVGKYYADKVVNASIVLIK